MTQFCSELLIYWLLIEGPKHLYELSVCLSNGDLGRGYGIKGPGTGVWGPGTEGLGPGTGAPRD